MNYTFKAWKRIDGMVEWALAEATPDGITFSGGVMNTDNAVEYIKSMKLLQALHQGLLPEDNPSIVGPRLVQLALEAPTPSP